MYFRSLFTIIPVLFGITIASLHGMDAGLSTPSKPIPKKYTVTCPYSAQCHTTLTGNQEDIVDTVFFHLLYVHSTVPANLSSDSILTCSGCGTQFIGCREASMHHYLYTCDKKDENRSFLKKKHSPVIDQIRAHLKL